MSSEANVFTMWRGVISRVRHLVTASGLCRQKHACTHDHIHRHVSPTKADYSSVSENFSVTQKNVHRPRRHDRAEASDSSMFLRHELMRVTAPRKTGGVRPLVLHLCEACPHQKRLQGHLQTL